MRATRGDLERQCWILREETATTRRDVDAWLDFHAISPARTMTFNGPDAVKRAVMAGLGIAMVSKMTVEDELAAGRLTGLAIGLPLPARDICVIDHPQKHHGAACSAMFQLFAGRFPASTIRAHGN